MLKVQRLSPLTRLQAPQHSSVAVSQGEPCYEPQLPWLQQAAQTSVPGAVWASHKSGFCPHRTHRLPLNDENENLPSHSCVRWLPSQGLNWSDFVQQLHKKTEIVRKQLSKPFTVSLLETTSSYFASHQT